MPSKFNLIVAEGHWNNYSNQSVKTLFDLLSQLMRSNHDAYKYIQFANPTVLKSNLNEFRDSELYQYLYIGSHGDETGIYGSDDGKALTPTLLINQLDGFAGLFIGACLFGQNAMLERCLESSNLTWCAGYRKSIDWIDSSALDLAFWKIYQINNSKPGTKNPLNLIDKTIDELKAKYSSLILDLGFNVAIKRRVGRKNQITLAF
jgi:hypothetical protein